MGVRAATPWLLPPVAGGVRSIVEVGRGAKGDAAAALTVAPPGVETEDEGTGYEGGLNKRSEAPEAEATVPILSSNVVLLGGC